MSRVRLMGCLSLGIGMVSWVVVSSFKGSKLDGVHRTWNEGWCIDF